MTQGQAESRKKKLQTARKNINGAQSTVKSKRKSYNEAVKQLNWKGDSYKRIIKDKDVDGAFGRWLWRAAWGADGSINGCLDKLDTEIDGLVGFLKGFGN